MDHKSGMVQYGPLSKTWSRKFLSVRALSDSIRTHPDRYWFLVQSESLVHVSIGLWNQRTARLKKNVFEIMNDSSLANLRLQSVTKCMQLDFNHHFERWDIFLFGKKFWTNRYVKLGTLYTTSDFISEKILYNTY